MEPKNIHTEFLNKFLGWSRKSASVEEIADAIGTLDRDAYLALVAEWKATLNELIREIREAKVMRKTAPTETERNGWNYTRWTLRYKAHALMRVRAGIKELARRHWAAKKAEVAA